VSAGEEGGHRSFVVHVHQPAAPRVADGKQRFALAPGQIAPNRIATTEPTRSRPVPLLLARHRSERRCSFRRSLSGCPQKNGRRRGMARLFEMISC
jgi:hypothetical protein